MASIEAVEAFEKELVDSRNNSTLPSCKSINEPVAGLFIANDSMNNAEWIEGKRDFGISHILRTKQIDPITKQFITVNGILVTAPKLLIIRSSPVLKVNSETNRTEGIWSRSDAILKEEKKAYCVKRYLLFFLDDDLTFLHSKPIQLTAKGNFMFKFDSLWTEFILHMLRMAGQCKQNLFLQGNEADAWFAALSIYCPKFESQVVGVPGKRSNACITVDYKKPDEDYNELHFGKRAERSIILPIFQRERKWYERAFAKNAASSLTSSPTDADEPKIVYEEVDD